VRAGVAARGKVLREIRTILVPTDFSDVSVVALQYARALARRLEARIIVAHVLEDRLSLVRGDGPGSSSLEKSIEFLRNWADESLEQLVTKHLGDLRAVERHVVVGVPHVKIVDLTEARNVDLIVMATHRTRFDSRPRSGSATDRVSRLATCPVLVVRDRRMTRHRTAS
jgi:nucleotide-binding universal stress UspA family protein